MVYIDGRWITWCHSIFVLGGPTYHHPGWVRRGVPTGWFISTGQTKVNEGVPRRMMCSQIRLNLLTEILTYRTHLTYMEKGSDELSIRLKARVGK